MKSLLLVSTNLTRKTQGLLFTLNSNKSKLVLTNNITSLNTTSVMSCQWDLLCAEPNPLATVLVMARETRALHPRDRHNSEPWNSTIYQSVTKRIRMLPAVPCFLHAVHTHSCQNVQLHLISMVNLKKQFSFLKNGDHLQEKLNKDIFVQQSGSRHFCKHLQS